MSERLGASTGGEANDLDERIHAFERAVPDWDGWDQWKPESTLPAPRAEFYELLIAARRGLDPREKPYRRLSDLILKLMYYVPDADVGAVRPFLAQSGAITGRRPRKPARAQEYERVVERFRGHRAEARRLLLAAGIEDDMSGDLVEEEDGLAGTAFGWAYMLYTFWKWVALGVVALPRFIVRALFGRR